MSKTLTFLSTLSDVQEFLESRDFDETIIATLRKFDGQALLGLPETSLLRLCGVGEGDRLLGILNSVKILTSKGIITFKIFLCGNY